MMVCGKKGGSGMKIIITLFTLLGWSLQAGAYIIDFEEFEPGFISGSGLVSGDYQIHTDYSFDFPNGSGGAYITETNTLQILGDASWFDDSYVEMTVERVDGGSFSLYSIDVLADYDPDGYYLSALTTAGYYIDDQGDLANLGQGDWLNIVQFSYLTSQPPATIGSLLEVDNIVVTAVPIPAAVWLFGSALAGLGWLRRKQTV
jgi:hypothetical protein